MKQFNKILGIIAGIFFLLGIMLVAIGYVKGGFKELEEGSVLSTLPYTGWFNDGSYNEENVSEDLREMVIDNGEEAIYAAADVEKIKISLGGCQIKITESDSDDIKITHSKDYKMKSYISGESLHIESKTDTKLSSNSKVLIEIPANIQFRDVDIELGAVDFISDIKLNCENIDIEVGAGSVDFKDITANDMKLNGGAGEINLANANVDNANIALGMGSIIYSGDIKKDLDLNVSMGSLEMTLNSAEKEHNYTVSAAGGSVSIGSNSVDGFGSDRTIDNNVESEYNIDCAMGSVDIDFCEKM